MSFKRTIAVIGAWARLEASRGPAGAHSEANEDPRDPDWSELGLDALIDAMLARLSARRRAAIEQYAGAAVPRLARGEVARTLGVCPSRVSQILRECTCTIANEREAMAVFAARLHPVLEGGALTLPALIARDPWLTPIRDRWALACILFSALPGRRVYALKLDGEWLLGHFSQQALDDALSAASREFDASPGCVEDATVDAIAARHGRALGAAIEAAVKARLHARPRLPVYEHLSPLQIEARLRASPAPIRADAFSHSDSGIKWPKTAVMLPGGRVTLVERFDGFDDFARVAIPRCIAWIRAHGPGEVWRCSELTEALAGVEVPRWFEPIMLGAMAVRVGGLRRQHHDCITLPERKPSGRRTHPRRSTVSAIPAASR